MKTLTFESTDKQHVLDITQQVQEQVGALSSGVVILHILHTTAAVTTADLDPGTDQDMLESYLNMLPVPQGGFRHPHDPDHAPAHLLASLIGPSLTLVVEDGQLRLGTWQRVVLMEFDGPRSRTVSVQLLSAAD